jgi:choline dehydrogenase-like flavoprotein
LLNSASNLFPNGLANSSGQVGRNYMRHMTGSVYAAFEKSVHMYRGTTMAGIIRDEAKHDPKRGFAGGYEMETLSIGIPFMAAFLNPGAWGRPFTSAMESYPRMAGMWLVGEDMPQETNRITLDPKAKDKFGQAHDVKNLFVSDGSQFTSGAACNPTLTIVSLAIRQADHIAGAMQRK